MAVRVFYQWILMAVPLVALILAVVGLATPNWYKTTVATQSSFTVGYFVVCVSSTATDQCFTYMSYNQVNSLPGSFAGSIAFHVIGITLTGLAILLIICNAGHCTEDCPMGVCRTERTVFMSLACITFMAGLCLLVPVIWMAVANISNVSGTVADYSLALTAAAAAILILMGVIIYMMGLRGDDDEYDDRYPKQFLEPAYTPRPGPYQYVEPPPNQPAYRMEEPPPRIRHEGAYRTSEWDRDKPVYSVKPPAHRVERPVQQEAPEARVYRVQMPSYQYAEHEGYHNQEPTTYRIRAEPQQAYPSNSPRSYGYDMGNDRHRDYDYDVSRATRNTRDMDRDRPFIKLAATSRQY